MRMQSLVHTLISMRVQAISVRKSGPWRVEIQLVACYIPWASCQICKIACCACAGMPGTFSPPPRVSESGMHHSTCVTHVPWCVPGSLTNGFLWCRWRGKRSRYFRRMRNPQFYVAGKRPMTEAIRGIRRDAVAVKGLRNPARKISISSIKHRKGTNIVINIPTDIPILNGSRISNYIPLKTKDAITYSLFNLRASLLFPPGTPIVTSHDDVIKWNHFPRYWPFVRGIHRSPVNSPHKGQWRGALMFSLICARINAWANNRYAGDLRRRHAHCDVNVMIRVGGWGLDPITLSWRNGIVLRRLWLLAPANHLHMYNGL